MEPDLWVRCGRLARWLPRSLAGALLVVALTAALRLDVESALGTSLRPFLALVGGALAIGIVRRGAELRTAIGLTDATLVIAWAGKRRTLPFERIRRVDFAMPFGGSRNWLPAAVLEDDRGIVWRVPVLHEDGARLVEELLRRAGRSDLATWAEVHGVVAAMRRRRCWLATGYVVAGTILAIGVGYYWV